MKTTKAVTLNAALGLQKVMKSEPISCQNATAEMSSHFSLWRWTTARQSVSNWLSLWRFLLELKHITYVLIKIRGFANE